MMIGDLDPVLVRTFLTVVEERNLTAAGRRLFRTQPAITMQIKRLEAALGRHLFVRNSRKFSLTHDGELLLPYARELIRVNDAARAFLSKPTVEGRVVLGTSDLYAASVLPSVLRQFNRNFPKVELLLRCMLSSKLHKAVSNGDVDLAVVTKLPGNEKGTFLRKESLVWVAHKDFVVDPKEDIPLAMLPEGIFREMALDALNSVGRSYKIAWTSDSIAGLQAAIFSGLAISVLIRPAVNPEMKILGESSGLPPLGQIDLVLRSGGKDLSPAGDTLSRHIVETLGAKGIEQPVP